MKVKTRNFILGALVILLFALPYFSYNRINKLREAYELVEHTHLVKLKLQNILTEVLNAETHQRGFLLTEKQDLYNRYYAAQSTTLKELTETMGLVSDDSVQLANMSSVRILITERFKVLASTLELAKTGDSSRIEKSILRGAALMNLCREKITAMIALEDVLLAGRLRERERAAFVTPVVLPVVTTLTVILLLLTVLKIRQDSVRLAHLNRSLSEREKQATEGNQKLSEMTKLLNSILEGTRHGITHLAAVREGDQVTDFKIVFSNAHIRDVGLSSETAKGKTLTELFPETKNSEEGLKMYKDVLATGTPSMVETRYTTDKVDVWLEIHTQRTDEDHLTVTHRDITEEKKNAARMEQMYQELSEARELLQLVLDSSVDAVAALDANLNFMFVNKAGAKYLQRPVEELVGMSATYLMPKIEGSSVHQHMLEALKGVYVHDSKVPSYASPGVFFDAHYIPLRQKNKPHGVLLILKDITHLMKTSSQLDLMNKQLVNKNSELEAINQELSSFSYVASHDLKEPLRKIQTFANRISDKERPHLNENTIEYLNRIIGATERMQKLIDALLDFSRTTNSDAVFKTTDLNKVMSDVLAGLREVIDEKKAEIRIPELPVIEAVPVQMQQLFQNLISNSLKYSRKDVPPVITVEVSEVKEMETPGGILEGDWIELRFTDNGIGFDPQYANKIFEIFQRLHGKSEYEGTGIGLAIVKKIAATHKGAIRAESQPDKGATFIVHLAKNPSAPDSTPASGNV
jgi:PAS domain S-box-containing protein